MRKFHDLFKSKSSFTLFYCLLSFLLLGFAFSSVYFESSISWRNHTYAFLRALTTKEGNYGYLQLNSSAFSNTKDFRSFAYSEGKERGIYGPKAFFYVMPLADGFTDPAFPVSRNAVSYGDYSLMALPTYCDGNTRLDDGRLSTVPIDVVFPNNGTCDVRQYAGKDGSTYIPTELADAMLGHAGTVEDYRGVLGKTIDVNGRSYSISNLYYSDADMAPTLTALHGRFLVINDYAAIDMAGGAKVSVHYQCDTEAHNDVCSFFKLVKPTKASFAYLRGTAVSTDSLCDFFARRLIQGDVGFMPPVWYAVVALVLYFAWAVLTYKSAVNRWLPKWVIIALSSVCLSFLLVVNVANLFFYGNVALLQVFHDGLALPCVFFLVALFFAFIKKVFLNKQYHKGESDEFDI